MPSGDLYGGDGKSSFAIPDYRGYFLRCVDGGSGNDPDLNKRTPPSGGTKADPGSSQDPALQMHEHHYVKPLQPSASGSAESTAVPGDDPMGVTEDLLNKDGQPLQFTSDSETRPKNVYVNYLIKYAYLKNS